MHARQQIRNAIVTAVTGLSTTGSAVHRSRVYPVETLPCLAVYTVQDTAQEEQGIMGAAMMRIAEITIEAKVRAAADGDDVIDTICEEVETALGADTTLGGLAKDVMYESTSIEMDDEAEQPSLTATLVISVVYRVNEGAPGTIIN